MTTIPGETPEHDQPDEPTEPGVAPDGDPETGDADEGETAGLVEG